MRGADLTERGMLFQQGAATAKAWMPLELKFRSQDSRGPKSDNLTDLEVD